MEDRMPAMHHASQYSSSLALPQPSGVRSYEPGMNSSSSTPSMPSAGAGGPPGQHMIMVSSNNASYPQYNSASVSSGDAHNHNPQIPSPAPVGTSLISSAPGLTGTQKRAYRQRRKDPSCDACRERKVKCDATDTTSCSECASRNVKCQFTKETNRRMSSIKQVQDLEKQLAQAMAKIARLQARDSPNGGFNDRHYDPPNFPEVGSNPERRHQPPVMQDLTNVRSHLRNYARGVFKPPPPYRQVGVQLHFNPPLPDLPPKHVADHILAQYYQTIHALIPILHWPQFVQTYEEVRKKGDLKSAPPSWSSTLFAVFACGLLYTVDPVIKAQYPDNGRAFIVTSRQLTDLFNDEFDIDHARAALLTSIFLTELNSKSAAWTWLGSTVRIAQDIGLHRESGPWPVVEGEMRRRVWWGIYVWDRLLSVELGRVLLIDDQDCDIPLPCALDDHFIYPTGILVPTPSAQPANFLLTMIHIVRLISPLLRSLQAPVISPQTLACFDEHFISCLVAFPVDCRIDHPQPLEPRHLTPICHLQNCRLVLHRHNLSTSCSPEVRSAAIDSCVAAAKDTVHLLSRTMKCEPQDSNRYDIGAGWQGMMAASAATMLCTHIWRCALFLCFRAQYAEALICVQVCAAIGNVRRVNVACGRNLYGFLRVIADKLAAGLNIDQDEELMALVSGDVQGSTESSWVWTGSETGSALNTPSSMNVPDRKDYGPSNSSSEPSNSLSDGGVLDDWGGWSHVERMVQTLMNEKMMRDEQLQQQAQQAQQQQQQPWNLPPASASGRSTPAPTSNSRISIANIITELAH